MYTGIIKSELPNNIPERILVHLDKVQSSGNRLVKLVDGILTYSSQKSEQIVYEDVDLNEVIKNIESDLELMIHEKNAVINTKELNVVKGSSFMLYQMFYNLINNALKFSRQEVNTIIEISSSIVNGNEIKDALLTEKAYHEIIVKDNGIGFDQSQADNIFSTFKRLNSKAHYEGTGLGLSLVKSIIEKHEGLINAYGEINVGSTFKIYLPQSLT